MIEHLNTLTDLQDEFWSKKGDATYEHYKSRASRFFKAYSLELKSMYSKASVDDKKAIKILNEYMKKWCVNDVACVAKMHKYLNDFCFYFQGSKAAESCLKNDALLIEMSKLNKKSLAFSRTFVNSLTAAFRKLKFNDKDLRKYCVDLVKDFKKDMSKTQRGRRRK